MWQVDTHLRVKWSRKVRSAAKEATSESKNFGPAATGSLESGPGRRCEPLKILSDQIDLGRKPFERLPRSDQVGIFRGHFQLLRMYGSSR
jgi:hypothetical protein